MAETEFDLIVIGSGPGGYVCAIRAAQLGLKTALVEKDANLGGTCMNVGCIPSKALLHSTEIYHQTVATAKSHGIETGPVTIDLGRLMEKKDGVVNRLQKGVEALVKGRKIAIFKGFGRLTGSGAVEVKSGNDSRIIKADNIVLATGSKAAELPFLKFDGKTVVSSDQAIAFDEVPSKLVVVGGGAIGLELGSVWSRLGSEVSIVEFLPNIAPTFDPDVSKRAMHYFKKQRMSIHTSAKVTGLDKKDGRIFVQVEKKGTTSDFEADKVLVCVGRKPFNEGLGLKEAGVETTSHGFIKTEKGFRTSASGIFAIGDTTEGPMLAHKAEEEGVAVAEIISGHHGEVNYKIIPNVIYTDPEIAGVGLTETQAKDEGLAVKVGKFPFSANGRAIASDAQDGFVKVLADAKTDRVLGVQILAKNASELIAAAVAHMEYGGSAEDIARTIHAHPTLSEALKEAALAVDKASIHSL